MTQKSEAQKGNITPEMEIVAKQENIDVNKLTDSQLSDVVSRINNMNSYENYTKSHKKKK